MGWNGIGWFIALGLGALGSAVTYLWPSFREFGYFLVAVGVIALVVATVGVVRSGWPHFKALGVRLGAVRTMLLVGLLGTWLFLTLTLGVFAWMHLRGAEAKAAASRADDGPLKWFSNLEMEGGPPLGRPVFSMTFHGGNASQKEVLLKKANIVSAVNGKKIDLEIIAQDDAGRSDLTSIGSINLVPPGAPIRLVAKFGDPDPNAPGKVLGLDAKTFLESWRQFYFNVEDDTRAYRLPYNEGNLMPFFPGTVGPHITKKSNR